MPPLPFPIHFRSPSLPYPSTSLFPLTLFSPLPFSLPNLLLPLYPPQYPCSSTSLLFPTFFLFIFFFILPFYTLHYTNVLPPLSPVLSGCLHASFLYYLFMLLSNILPLSQVLSVCLLPQDLISHLGRWEKGRGGLVWTEFFHIFQRGFRVDFTEFFGKK